MAKPKKRVAARTGYNLNRTVTSSRHLLRYKSARE
jgi:hypothetical protein